MAGATYRGSLPATAPRYKRGLTITAGVKLSPALQKQLRKREQKKSEEQKAQTSSLVEKVPRSQKE